jgi:hypothetical protein
LSIALTAELATRFTQIALSHVTREYPHKLDHVMGGDEDATPPRVQHPLFHGSFDWHSCVHGYWTLARCYRRFPERPECGAVRGLFDRMLTPANVAGELAYLARPLSRGFERPYGWAWALALCAELDRHDSEDGRRWASVLAPFGRAFADRYLNFLPRADYPVRSGVHSSSAFAATLALDYAVRIGDAPLRDALTARLSMWFGQDRDAQAWEPNGEDFLSATLMEAEAMRRAMPPKPFSLWLAGFLPRLALRKPAALFAPARVSDRTDGKIAHLDGLNFSRAWCFRGIASALDADDPARIACLEAAEAHVPAALPHVAGDYMGEHWLATFAVLALDGL